MLKFGIKLLQDRKSRELQVKSGNAGTNTTLPAFEWQLVATPQTTGSGHLQLPDDAILGSSGKRRHSSVRYSSSSKRDTVASPESSRLRMIQIIHNEEARAKFRAYLVSQYCEENLDFYVQVMEYREIFEEVERSMLKGEERARREKDMRREAISMASCIWNLYLNDEKASKPLNVPRELSNQCRRNVEEGNYTVDLFDKLQQHCFELMVQDSLPKFTRSSTCGDNSSSRKKSHSSSFSASSFLRPPSFITSSSFHPSSSPRKTASNSSLRASFSNIASIVSQSDLGIRTVNLLANGRGIPEKRQLPPSPPSPSSQSSSSSVSSSLVQSHQQSGFYNSNTNSNNHNNNNNNNNNNTTSTSQNRISMASFSNLTRRMLAPRRDSVSSISSQTSTIAATVSSTNTSRNSSANNSPKLQGMPGCYPASRVGCANMLSERSDNSINSEFERECDGYGIEATDNDNQHRGGYYNGNGHNSSNVVYPKRMNNVHPAITELSINLRRNMSAPNLHLNVIKPSWIHGGSIDSSFMDKSLPPTPS